MKYFLFIILLLTTGSSFAQRKRINFDDNWKFAFGHANDPLKDLTTALLPFFQRQALHSKPPSI